MKWLGKALATLQGAYYKAPLAVIVIGVVCVFGLVGWVLGLHEQNGTVVSPPHPSIPTPPPVASVGESSLPKLPTSFPKIPPWNLEAALGEAPPKQAAEVVARLMWLLNVPIDGTHVTKEDVLNQIQPLCIGPLYDEIESKYKPPMEGEQWTHIRVLTVKKLQSDPEWWMVFVSADVGGKMDAGVFMQVRKEGTVWRVVSIDEPTGTGNES